MVSPLVTGTDSGYVNSTISAMDTSFTSSLLESLFSGSLSDVTITVQDEVFEAHRVILSGASPVFKAMLHGEFKEAVTGEISIDENPKVIRTFLEFIYTGKVNCEVTHLDKLFEVSRKYQVDALYDVCIRMFKNNLSPVQLMNTCNSLCYICNNVEDDQNFAPILSQLADNMKILLRERSFYSLKYEFLLQLLHHYIIVDSEINLFEALVQWTKNLEGGLDKNTKVFQSLMYRVDFVEISSADLASRVNPFRKYLPTDYLMDCLLQKGHPEHPCNRPVRQPPITFSNNDKDDQIIVESPTLLTVSANSRSNTNQNGYGGPHYSMPNTYKTILGSFPLVRGRVYKWRVRFSDPAWVHYIGITEKKNVFFGYRYCNTKYAMGCSHNQLSNFVEVEVDLRSEQNMITVRNASDGNTIYSNQFISSSNDYYPLFVFYCKNQLKVELS
ncbi:hypothetical protein P9112_005152 [Eukaryota sp. TZLM1-RC]